MKVPAIASRSDIIICHLILPGCLQGARDEAHAAHIAAALRPLQLEDTPTDQPASETARL